MSHFKKSRCNNKILNINSFNLDKNKVKNILEDNFNPNYIINGQKSLANFAVQHFLKDENGNLSYICTDPSRHIFKYKDGLGEIQKDVKAKKLTNLLVESGLKNINSQIATDYWTNEDGSHNNEKFCLLEPKATEIHNITDDNSVFVNELSSITTL